MGVKNLLVLDLWSIFFEVFSTFLPVRILSSIILRSRHLPPITGFSNMTHDKRKHVFSLLQSSSCSHQNHPHLFIPFFQGYILTLTVNTSGNYHLF